MQFCSFPNLKLVITRKMNILLIEDDAIEVMKLERAISKLGVEHQLIKARDGEEALSLLQSGGALPDVVFLDLNMPKINGIDFLKILKADERLQFLPTMILTTSANRKDMLECYKIGVAGYLIKPLKYDDYVNKIKIALDYWSINELIDS
tara:strand:- start:46981 stop:47430 length:450 start_codon:yes stop_codon:yes gene_type:complete